MTLSRLANVYRLEGILSEAAAAYGRAIAVWRQLEGDGAKKNLAVALYHLGDVQRLLGLPHEAANSYKKSLEVAQHAFGPQDPQLANILYRYSDILWHQNQWVQALEP